LFQVIVIRQSCQEITCPDRGRVTTRLWQEHVQKLVQSDWVECRRERGIKDERSEEEMRSQSVKSPKAIQERKEETLGHRRGGEGEKRGGKRRR
jgi:hypothetical protein